MMGVKDADEGDGLRFDEYLYKKFVLFCFCDHVIATSEQQIDLIDRGYLLRKDHITMILPRIGEARLTPSTQQTTSGRSSRINRE